MIHRLAPLAVFLLSACAGGQPAGPAMTRGTVPRDARGNAVLEAVPPPPATPIAAPAPGAAAQ